MDAAMKYCIAGALLFVGLLAGCSNDPGLDMNGEPRPELPVMESTTEVPGEDSVTLRPVFVAEGFQAWGTIDAVAMYDADGNEIQRYTGRIQIATHNGWTDVILPDAPANFDTIDIQFNDLLIGGGDVGGLDIEIGGGDVGGHDFEMGGGDVGGLRIDGHAIMPGGGDVGGYAVNGLVLPHLIIRRYGNTVWHQPRVRFSAYSLAVSAPPEERMELARQLVESLDVTEGNQPVGFGMWEETARAIAKWPAVETGTDKCYDDTVMLASCEGDVWSDQCADTPFCGQDAQYADGEWWPESSSGSPYMSDDRTELLWDKNSETCNGGYPCPDASTARAVCEAKGMRLPTLWEVRTILEFNEFSGESIVGPGTNGDLITSTLVNDREMCLDTSRRLPIICDDSTGYVYPLCVKGDPFVNSELISVPGGIDTTIGALWNLSTSTGTWEEALAACQASRQWGFNDWRLPNIAELTVLSQRPELDLTGSYWSATTDGPRPEKALIITPSLWSSQEKQQDAGFVCVRNIP